MVKVIKKKVNYQSKDKKFIVSIEYCKKSKGDYCD